VQTYIHEFNQYFKENFGWRNALFYQYSQWKFRILGSSPLPEKVVIGKAGWFYPGNDFNRIADQHRGLHPLSPDKLALIATRLTRYQQILAQQGTRLYIMVAPDSYSIYPEYLPDYLRRKPLVCNFNLLKQHLARTTSLSFVDVRRAMLQAKTDRQLYLRTDTHWNNYGSLVASLTLIDRIRQDFPQIPAVRLTNYQIKPIKGEGGDLTTMLALNRGYKDSVDYQIKPALCLSSKLKASNVSADRRLPSQQFIGPDSGLPTLLLVGDSFSYSMNQFVPGYFSESYLLRSNRLDLNLVQQKKPDVIVIEIVERNIDLLTNL
jgi:hypothetical protein